MYPVVSAWSQHIRGYKILCGLVDPNIRMFVALKFLPIYLFLSLSSSAAHLRLDWYLIQYDIGSKTEWGFMKIKEAKQPKGTKINSSIFGCVGCHLGCPLSRLKIKLDGSDSVAGHDIQFFFS